jgi:hypothetical protein
MSQVIDNLIASEVAYLVNTGKGFATCVDGILVARKFYNDIVTSYMENGKQDTVVKFRELGGHLHYLLSTVEADTDVGEEGQKQGFGHWVIAIDERVAAAEVACAAMDEAAVMDVLLEILRLCRGALSQYNGDVLQREGYEVGE